MNMQSTKDKRALHSALFGVSSDIRYAYENGETEEVTDELIDILNRRVPEDELKYIVSYLNDRIYE